jgi:hypothetical protein
MTIPGRGINRQISRAKPERYQRVRHFGQSRQARHVFNEPFFLNGLTVKVSLNITALDSGIIAKSKIVKTPGIIKPTTLQICLDKFAGIGSSPFIASHTDFSAARWRK